MLLQFLLRHAISGADNKHVDEYQSRDILLHPDLAAMSLTKLADLPLMPEHLGRTIDMAKETPYGGGRR